MSIQAAISILVLTLPIVVSLSCSGLIFLCLHKNIQIAAKRLVYLLVVYFLAAAISWFSILVFKWFPEAFIYINELCYFVFLIHAVLFYHIVFEVTRSSEQEHFSYWHYFVPVLLPLILFVWSRFVPVSEQMALNINMTEVENANSWYARFYTSKISMRLIFSIIYTSLGIVRIHRYHKYVVAAQVKLADFWEKWLIMLLLLSFLLVIMPLLAFISSKSTFLDSVLPLVGILTLAGLHITLTFNMVNGNYMLITYSQTLPDITQQEDEEKIEAEEKTKQQVAIKTAPMIAEGAVQPPQPATKRAKEISLKEFHRWYVKNKPYLNQNLKLEDITTMTGIKRNELSAYINKKYQMNFNEFINSWRLKELQRLEKTPRYAKLGIMKLLPIAGFGSYRAYARAKDKQDKTASKK